MGPLDRWQMIDPPGGGLSPDSAPATRPGLFVGAKPLAFSSHAGLACVDCHTQATQIPHIPELGQPACQTCHAEAQLHFDRSAHAEAMAAGDPDAPTCASCHGGHEILPSDQRHSMTHPFNAVGVCSDCHEHHATRHLNGDEAKEHIQSYLEGVHGQGVQKAGLVLSATCSNCHNHHAVLHSDNPLATTSRDNISATCGECHLGVVEVYASSVHGELLKQGDERAPVCTDCHAAHRIKLASVEESLVDVVAECGECHARADMTESGRATFYETYRMTYHGQVSALGSKLAARCSDCHGAHDILPATDPVSRVHASNLQATCQTCHENANANFIQYDPHADYRDRERYPLLNGVWWYFIIVMSSAFGFFGLHSIFWFLRSLVDRIRHGKQPRPKYGKKGIRRFTLINRVNHAFVIITFFGLTLTGMPLLFADQTWAMALATVIGGVEAAGIVHRGFAIMLFGNFAVHFYSIYRSARARRGSLIQSWLLGPNSMVPRWKDLMDCLGMGRWFLFGGEKPRFDRFTYWEKFDYWAEIGGTGIIGVSGLLLWFPEFFALFLPGWMFNVATLIHGYEALLAVGFIFTIHFFNAHLRAEKFPVDDVIFTGLLPEEEFKHERPAEYDRLTAEGRLEEFEEPAPAAWTRRFAIIVGIAAMTVGTGLVVLIVLAGLDVI
jgi:cytochrome b subunit of formate dehydrogenase